MIRYKITKVDQLETMSDMKKRKAEKGGFLKSKKEEIIKRDVTISKSTVFSR